MGDFRIVETMRDGCPDAEPPRCGSCRYWVGADSCSGAGICAMAWCLAEPADCDQAARCIVHEDCGCDRPGEWFRAI